jgi:hypothetical protein
MWILGAVSQAHAQSLFEKYATPAPASRTWPPPPRTTEPESTPAPQAAVPEPAAPAEGDADDLEEPSVWREEPAGSDSDDGEELLARIDALEAQIASFRAVPAPAPAPPGREERDGERPAVVAGFTLASAYAYRGLNLFGSSQSAGAALIAPLLAVRAGDVTAGWFASFQATGPRKEALVRQGVGHEQDAFVKVHRALTGGIEVDAALTATAYPWADPDVAGAALPVWVEPLVTLTADLGGPALSLTASHLQGLGDGFGEGSYTYGNVGLADHVDLADHGTLFLGASGGAKAWNVGPQGRDNTWDLDLVWGLELDTDALTVRPTGHLTWTNLAPATVGAETFAWVGLDASVGL